MAAVDADVVVIGAGITGAAVARALARLGHEVIVLERFELGHEHGSSHGTSRIFRLSYPQGAYVRLAQASLHGWRELEDERGSELLVTTGSLDLGAFVAQNAPALRSCGAAFEILNSRAAAERWRLRLEPEETALYQPDAGVLLADLSLQALVDSALDAGATLREHAQAVGIVDHGGHVAVETGGGVLGARAVVVAAGAWATQLLSPLEIELPVEPTRETVAHFRVPGPPVPCVIDDETPLTGIGRAGSVTYALSSPDLGVKVGLHHSGPAVDPDDHGVADTGVISWASEWAGRRFPDADPEPALVETCLYTNTHDESFVLERHGRIVVASACSGHGFKFAPEIGRMVAELAVDAL